MDRAFRFGVNLIDISDPAAFTAKAARAESLGYDVVLLPDHLGWPAPFPALVAAAGATERVRLGTFVLNAAFYAPDLLARDAAATDALIGGRLELGLGTGYAKEEFDRAGLDYGTPGERFAHLAATVDRVRTLLDDPGYRPAPAQRPVPLLLGGHGERTLRLAARRADIVGFAGLAADDDGTLWLATADVLDRRVELVRATAGARAAEVELNVLVQVAAPADPAWREYAPEMTDEQFAALPTMLLGTPAEIADQVRAARRRFGFTYITVLEGSMEHFGEVIPLLREDVRTFARA